VFGRITANRRICVKPLVQLWDSCCHRPTSRLNTFGSQLTFTTEPGTIEKIVSDKVVSEVVIRTAAGNITSIITTGSVKRMNLKEGVYRGEQ
jgi:hypothetical protein